MEIRLSARFIALVGVLTFATCSTLHAHFVFVKSTSDDKGGREAVVYFSEAGHVDGQRLPEKVKATQLFVRKADGKPRATSKVTEEDRDGWIAMFQGLGDPKAFALEAECDYGIHHGTMLRYRAKHVYFSDASELSKLGVAKQFALDLVPAVEGSKIVFTTLWKGTPTGDIELAIEDAAGEMTELTTDKRGKASIDAAKHGFYSARAHHEVSDDNGTFQGEDYEGASYYTTLTLNVSTHSSHGKEKRPAATNSANTLSLPEAISSFGGVVCDGQLYVYSGHTGTAHAHSKHNLSQNFRRISLSKEATWEELPFETPLQGLPLVAYNGDVYRIGGLRALNEDVDTPDLHSTNEFSRFDPETNSWTRLTDLPEARSSHDAVVIGKTLYVVGGWNLSGDEEGEWHEHALAADLSQKTITWSKIPVPFQRRALAASAVNGKLIVMGGMDDGHDICRAVSMYNPATNEWSVGPALPGDGMNGFGVSAWNLNNRLFVSGTDGNVYRLAENGKAWEPAHQLATPRFFHQLVPAPNGALLAVGGASMRQGHLTDIETIDLSGSSKAETDELQTVGQD